MEEKNRNNYPLRILHVLGGMNRGGTETWLMHVLRNIDRERFQMDFLVHTTQQCAYDEEIRELGSEIIPCMRPGQPWRYAINLRRILKEYGPYDIIHSHVHHYSGFVLWLAHMAGVPMRIAHSHSDTSHFDSSASTLRKAYLCFMEDQIRTHANIGLAGSEKAAASLFGSEWKRDSRWLILNYGVDFKLFTNSVDCKKIRKELGLPEDAFVVGHVGRFSQPKNHEFLVDITVEIVKREPATKLLLIGDGPLRPAIEDKVFELGLNENVVFTGLRADVPRLMLGAMDVFVFPSLYEGLGLVLVEAQAAGLPCIFSDVVPEEADIVVPLMRRLSLLDSPKCWADKVLSSRILEIEIKNKAIQNVDNSHFNISTNILHLSNIYLSTKGN